MNAPALQLELSLTLPSRRTVERPAAGVIVGGPCNGWSFVLLELRQVGGRRVPLVRATAPAWPFPRDVLVKPPARLQAMP